MAGSGTKDDLWVLKTPPGTSEYTMYRDDRADPAQLVRRGFDLADLRRPRRRGPPRLAAAAGRLGAARVGGRAEGGQGRPSRPGPLGVQPLGGRYGPRKGYRGRVGMYRRCWRSSARRGGAPAAQQPHARPLTPAGIARVGRGPTALSPPPWSTHSGADGRGDGRAGIWVAGSSSSTSAAWCSGSGSSGTSGDPACASWSRWRTGCGRSACGP